MGYFNLLVPGSPAPFLFFLEARVGRNRGRRLLFLFFFPRGERPGQIVLIIYEATKKNAAKCEQNLGGKVLARERVRGKNIPVMSASVSL